MQDRLRILLGRFVLSKEGGFFCVFRSRIEKIRTEADRDWSWFLI